MRGVLLAFLSCGFVAAASADETPALPEVQQRFSEYLTAFNEGDAAKIASFWSEDAVSLDGETGERTEGRDAIAEGFKTFFDASPGARLTGKIEHTHGLRDGVATIEGTVTLFTEDSDPVPSAFTAVLVKEGDEWLIAESQERDLPAPATPRDALADLAWLVGEWRDETETATVATSIRWAPGEAFLIRSFYVAFEDGESLDGTQVIGWDSYAKQIRTWTFNSDGSFGEGTATRNGDECQLKITHTGADGVLSNFTQVITRVDDDTMKVERIGQTVDGELAPSGEPVTVVRFKAETAAGGSK